jgi:DNA-binding transcriptional LysR family regulator
MSFADWALMQSFAAVVEAGSLSAAARKTGGSQPTMSRHIVALEQALGVRLFDRTGAGLVLTAIGVTLYEDAKIMAQAASRIALSAAGQSEAIAGTIRISASETMATTRFHQVEPDIAIELVSSDQTDNLLMREADIAVRMFQPAQAELIAKKVGAVRLGMFASKAYLDRAGTPTNFEDFTNHSVISGDISTEILDGFRAAGIPATRDYFAFRCDSRIVQWQMVLAGFGIGFIQADIGKRHLDIVHLFPNAPLGELPIWLTSHAELRTSRRVRRVFDYLADELSLSFNPRG